MAGLLDGVDLRTQMAGQNRLELLLFRLSSTQLYGINVFKVQEVIHCPHLTHMPGSHPVVRGIAKLRGTTVPVMDLSLAIGGIPTENTDGRFVIITEYNKRVQGFLVEAVDHIVDMVWEDILPPPKGAAGGYLTAVTQVGKKLVEIIDVEKVLKEVVGGSDEVSDGVIKDELRERQHHVLVVDDSLVARKQVKRVLDQLGIKSTLKNNGAEAMEQLQEWANEETERGKVGEWLSLVISDIEMPKLDGYSLTKRIREDPKLQNLRVVLHSSLSGVFNESMVRKVGANHFQPKYVPDELARMVQEQLRELDAEHERVSND